MSPVVEILGVVSPGKPGKVAPTFRVRCPPPCGRVYETRAWPRDLATRRSCRSCADERRRQLAAQRTRPIAPRPADLPAEEERYAHATRARYVAGCRCEPCREANNAYARMRGKLARMGRGDPLVSAARARRHLAGLSAAGVGRRTIAEAGGLVQSSLAAIAAGLKRKIRRSTEARILGVRARDVAGTRGGHLVDAAATWRRIARLLDDGFTRGEIAVRLGAKTRALQLRRDRVTARNAARVANLYRTIYVGG